MVVHHNATPVEGCHSIAGKGMHTKLEAFLLSVVFAEEHILRGKACLRGYKVRIHALPTAGKGTAVEHHLQTIAVGVGQNVFVELYHRLLVAAKEVDLNTCNANLLHPGHLAVACQRGAHTVAWSLRSIVPIAVRVVPQQQAHTFLLGITAQFGNAVTSDLCIPKGIDEHIFIAHRCCQVNHLYLIIVVA